MFRTIDIGACVMRIKSKLLKNNTGFTLAETLVAILILLMVSSIVAAGIPSATRAYQRATLRANAEVALSTTVSVLRDELGTARRIKASGNDISYESSKSGGISEITKKDNKVYLNIYKDIKKQDQAYHAPLLSDAMTTKQKVYVTYGSIEYDDKGVVTFNNIEVYRLGEVERPLAELEQLRIKVINNS